MSGIFDPLILKREHNMPKHTIAVYRAEQQVGLTDTILSNDSIAYVAQAQSLKISDEQIKYDLSKAFASQNKGEAESFDLYYMKDILATTGWNKNSDVFDRTDTWIARHTPEDKPFNFEHRPLDIIGHITASHALDSDMNEIDDGTLIDDLPNTFHILNGSVIYTGVGDDDRKNLMAQTVEEIKRGEWFVSMECFFRGFDYAVISPDGSQAVIARNEQSSFLTKHLAQYGGTGIYEHPETKESYQLGRVLRNITFSGKGLVKKPANPYSLILNNVASFIPVSKDTVYILTSSSNLQTETNSMPETNTNTNDQALRDQINTLQAEIVTLKNKDTETLRAEVSSRDSLIAERDQTIVSLKAQLATVSDSLTNEQKITNDLKVSLASAEGELAKVKASETKRTRESLLREKNAPADAIAGLVEKLSVLDDTAFAGTVEMISASWKNPKISDPVVNDINNAQVDKDANLSTANDNTDTARATVVDFIGKSLKSGRGNQSISNRNQK